MDEIVKVLGFVNRAPDFHQQPEVMHGFTDQQAEGFKRYLPLVGSELAVKAGGLD